MAANCAHKSTFRDRGRLSISVQSCDRSARSCAFRNFHDRVPSLFVPGLNCTGGSVRAADRGALAELALSRRRSLARRHDPGNRRGHPRRQRREGSRSPVFRSAATSLSRCCVRRRTASRGSRCSTRRRRRRSDAARDRRLHLLAMVQEGRFVEAEQEHWPDVVHPSRYGDVALREIKMRMAQELGPDLWRRHIAAIMGRAGFAADAGRREGADPRPRGRRRPADASGAGEGDGGGHCPCPSRRGSGMRPYGADRAPRCGERRAGRLDAPEPVLGRFSLSRALLPKCSRVSTGVPAGSRIALRASGKVAAPMPCRRNAL